MLLYFSNKKIFFCSILVIFPLRGQDNSGSLSKELRVEIADAPAIPTSSLWPFFDRQGILSKPLMIRTFIDDSKKYSSENVRMPQHIKNENSIRVMTYNIFAWMNPNGRKNSKGIISVIKEINPDILITEELVLFDEQKIKTEFAALGYVQSVFCDTFDDEWQGAPVGNMIFSKYPLEDIHVQSFRADLAGKSQEKRGYIQATAVLPHEKKITLFGTHLDVWDDSGELRDQEVTELINAIGSSRDNYIIAGDFNSVRKEDYNYLVNGKRAWDILTESTVERTGLPPATLALDLLKQHGFTDSFSKINLRSPRFTVWTGTAVDFIFLNKNWNLPVLGSYVHYNAESDHLPIVTDISLT